MTPSNLSTWLYYAYYLWAAIKLYDILLHSPSSILLASRASILTWPKFMKVHHAIHPTIPFSPPHYTFSMPTSSSMKRTRVQNISSLTNTHTHTHMYDCVLRARLERIMNPFLLDGLLKYDLDVPIRRKTPDPRRARRWRVSVAALAPKCTQ